MQKLDIRRFASRAELDAALADRLEQAIDAAATAAEDGGTALVLAGGHTPLPAYREVARRGPKRNPRLRILFSDDRYVPASSEASNYHAARPLLDALSLPGSQILRVRTELPLEEAAADYGRQLGELVHSGARVGLGLLGLGADGHTASLFRRDDLERARGRMAIAVQRPDGMQGISVTPEFLAKIAEPLFVVAGGGKEDAIEALIRHDTNLVALQAVAGCPRIELWVDQAAESTAKRP